MVSIGCRRNSNKDGLKELKEGIKGRINIS